MSVTEVSNFASLCDAKLRLEESMVAAAHSMSSSQQSGIQAVGTIRAEFKTWLSSFRSFDDRTHAWLTRTFGKKHPAASGFKEFLSGEYDTNFGYRLAYALRNVSEHEDDVLNDVTLRSAEVQDNVRASITVSIDSVKAAAQFDIKASIRAELVKLDGSVDVRKLVDAVMYSCERAHCRMIIDLRSEIGNSVALCTAFHEEALANDGDWALIITDFDIGSTGQGRIAERHNRWELAQLAERNMAEAVRVLDRPRVVIAAPDLSGQTGT